jgi:hypothetical protein
MTIGEQVPASELPASLRGVLRPSHRVEFRREDLREEAPPEVARVKTDFSATVFSGEPRAWVRYLGSEAEARYESGIGVWVHRQSDVQVLAFEAANADSEWLSELLRRGVRTLRQRIQHKPNVVQALNDLLFGPASGPDSTRIVVRLSPGLPALGTRELADPATGGAGDVRIVLQSQFVRQVHGAAQASEDLSKDEQLGLCWSLISRFVSQLAFPSVPRDRFTAKIDVFAKMTFVALNLLYDGRRSGRLEPSSIGAVYETLVAEANDLSTLDLYERHPYFRMLARLSFMLRAAPYSDYVAEARIAAREYLDASYLRLSLAGVMPDVAEAMSPMAIAMKRNLVKRPKPEVGRFGIIDTGDLDAWKTVDKPFKQLGFSILRQLGVGEFGRVYEVLNQNNPTFPARVALKVDRIIGKQRQAILEAAEAFRVGSELAGAPHLVRMYDTGKLKDERFTYHVLQLVDGDTLDNLVGVAGSEHASVTRPPVGGWSEAEARLIYDRAVASRSRGAQRKSAANPFRSGLSPAMLLDLLTSVLLAIEEVHELGYAINDLKNDNLMMSRRGQVKGIDLDSFGPVRVPLDMATDFMFLSGSILLLLFSTPSRFGPRRVRGRALEWEGLANDERLLRERLCESWPFGDVEAASEGRVGKQLLTDVFVDLVRRSRKLDYAKDPKLFSSDINRLIGVKRRLLAEDLVID